MKQNSLLQAGQFICLQASVCCTSAPQNGQALIDGVGTPTTSLLGQFWSICTRESLPPLVSITTNTCELFAMLKSVSGVEFSFNSCVPLSTRNGALFNDAFFCLISLNRSADVASCHNAVYNIIILGYTSLTSGKITVIESFCMFTIIVIMTGKSATNCTPSKTDS